MTGALGVFCTISCFRAFPYIIATYEKRREESRKGWLVGKRYGAAVISLFGDLGTSLRHKSGVAFSCKRGTYFHISTTHDMLSDSLVFPCYG